MAAIGDPLMKAAALPSNPTFDRYSAGEADPNPVAANPQKSVLPIPNHNPQPPDCLWALWERLGGSVGIARTPIFWFAATFSTAHSPPLQQFELLPLLLPQLLPLLLLQAQGLGVRRVETDYMVISGHITVNDWKWWMKLV